MVYIPCHCRLHSLHICLGVSPTDLILGRPAQDCTINQYTTLHYLLTVWCKSCFCNLQAQLVLWGLLYFFIFPKERLNSQIQNLTCIWSPAKTILVFLFASARGMIVSHSIACAASSNRICVKNPTKEKQTKC